MTMLPCSVYIVTLNCEKWIENTLQSVSQFDEVILVDSGSTDNTVAIAQQFANVKVFFNEWMGYSAQKNFALNLCTQPWVLNVDGDEVVSSQLVKDITQCIEQNTVQALDIPILEFFMGKQNSEHTRQNRKVRFFKKQNGQYDLTNLAHEGVLIDGTIAKANGFINHYGEESITVKLNKNNAYSSLKAQEKYAKNKPFNVIKLIGIFPIMFIKSYIFRRNFLNGWRGFIGSTINAFYAFLKEAKLYELYLNDTVKK